MKVGEDFAGSKVKSFNREENTVYTEDGNEYFLDFKWMYLLERLHKLEQPAVEFEEGENE